MLEELKKPIEELLTAGKDAVSNAARNNEESNIVFEKLSEKLSVYAGHATVENTELKYDKNYEPKGNE